MAASKIGAVLFDMGGTLVHYKLRGTTWHGLLRTGLEAGYHLLGQRKLMGEVRMDKFLETVLPIVEPDRGLPLPHRLAYACRKLEVTAPASAVEDMTELIWSQVSPLMQVEAQAWPLLAPMSRAQVRTALISNTPWDTPGKWLVPDLERLGLDRYIDEFILSGDVGKRKPDPAIFQRALAALRVRAQDTVLVGEDLRADIGGAQAVGIRAVWLQHAPAPAGVAVRPHATITELAQLPQALAQLLSL